MELKINPNAFFIFDLDDTLYPEIDYLKSAYRHISKKLEQFTGECIYNKMLKKYYNKENVFQWIITQYGDLPSEIDFPWLLNEYRTHIPSITLANEIKDFLEQVKSRSIPAGIITDGRSITQRNKLKSLNIEQFFQDIIISEEFGSEKPDERNYLFFVNKYPGKNFYFFGDNTSKDFIAPIKLGWQAICIKDCGNNIHPQVLTNNHVPISFISSFSDIILC